MKAFTSSHAAALFAATILFSAPALAQQDQPSMQQDQQQQEQVQPGPAAESLKEQAKAATQVAILNQKAIALADLALEKSNSPEVRVYAQRVKNAHQENLTLLRNWSEEKRAQVATALDFAVPERGVGGTGEMSDQQKQRIEKQLQEYGASLQEQAKDAQEEINELAQLEGEEFNKEFLSTIIDDQKEGAKLTEKAADQFAADTTFSALMGTTTRTLRQLNDRGQQVQEQIKG